MKPNQGCIMENKQLPVEGDDFNDVIFQIEKSFNITFDKADFYKGITYGDICQCIHSKMSRENTGGCTSQQAFYKIREAISANNPELKDSIKPDTPLENILGQDKRKAASYLKLKTNIETDLFETPMFIALPFSVIAFISFIAMFFKWEFAYVFGGCTLILYIASKTTTNLRFKTVRELVNYTTAYEYNTVRRYKNTYNTNEIEPIIKQLFKEGCLLEDDELQPERIIL